MNIHCEKTHNQRLSSIEDITESSKGKESLKRILYDLFQQNEAILFYGERPNFNESIKSKLEGKNEFTLENIPIYYDDFKLHFKCLNLNDFKMGLDWFIDFYFFFESATFVFVNQNRDTDSCFNSLIYLKPSWEELSDKYKCEVLFKGVEEDILWRGHSE
jgi:hypothetical protein